MREPNLSWQYNLAVPWIASSSSVNNDDESNGSSQFKTDGAWAYRLLQLERMTVFRGKLVRERRNIM